MRCPRAEDLFTLLTPISPVFKWIQCVLPFDIKCLMKTSKNVKDQRHSLFFPWNHPITSHSIVRFSVKPAGISQAAGALEITGQYCSSLSIWHNPLPTRSSLLSSTTEVENKWNPQTPLKLQVTIWPNFGLSSFPPLPVVNRHNAWRFSSYLVTIRIGENGGGGGCMGRVPSVGYQQHTQRSQSLSLGLHIFRLSCLDHCSKGFCYSWLNSTFLRELTTVCN